MRKQKFKNTTWLPDHEIEAIARCLLPDIIAFFETEDGVREFEEWKKQQEENKITEKIRYTN